MKSFLCLSLSLSLSLLFFSCKSNPYRQGQNLYVFHCQGCHMEDGSGLANLIPSLSSSEIIRSSPEQLICLIRHGLPKNEETSQQMPPNPTLNEVEMANLVNYLRHIYVPGSVAIQIHEIKSCLANCKPRQ